MVLVRSIRVYKIGAAPAPSPATGKHDGSKCTDWGKDCCGSPIWGEPQTCKDGYVPKPDKSCTLTTYKDCPKHHKGAGCYGCFPPEAAKPAPAPSPTGGECSAQAYWSSGYNMKSKKGPKGPYGENGGKWINTANCIDTFHVPEGCAYEVATGQGGTGTKYTFTKSECMNGGGKPGYDKVRSIRVYKVGAKPAPAPSPATGKHDGSKCTDWGKDCCGSPIWGEPQTCKDGYVPKPDKSCTLTTYKDCPKHHKGAGCYGCFPPEGGDAAPAPTPAPATGKHDGSKCSDIGSDCCASDTWGEPQTCKDGYVPKPDASCTLTKYANCKNHKGGVGCYGCYPPEAGGDTKVEYEKGLWIPGPVKISVHKDKSGVGVVDQIVKA